MGEQFPGKVGLKHDIPTARNVLRFYDSMLHSTRSDRDKKWFKHLVTSLILLCGEDFIDQFGPDGELTTLGWTAVLRMLISKDARMYGPWKIRWRHLFDIKFVEHLMHNSQELDYDFLGSMMHEDVLGYKIQWTKKLFLPVRMMGGFSFYVVDIEERNLLVMDPTETSIVDDEMRVKHEANAHLVLRGLRRCIRALFADWYIPPGAWSVTYAYIMNEPCEMEDSWVLLGHYWREYNGLYLERQLGDYELAYLKKQIAYEVISMKGNKGELPSFMIEEVLF